MPPFTTFMDGADPLNEELLLAALDDTIYRVHFLSLSA
jgi:hypothetical protein